MVQRQQSAFYALRPYAASSGDKFHAIIAARIGAEQHIKIGKDKFDTHTGAYQHARKACEGFLPKGTWNHEWLVERTV